MSRVFNIGFGTENFRYVTSIFGTENFASKTVLHHKHMCLLG